MAITRLLDSDGDALTSGTIAIHAALVPKFGGGAAIVYFGFENQARLYDLDAMDQAPAQLGTFPGEWAFCAGHALQGDGRWVIAGGIHNTLGNQDVLHHGPLHDSGEHRCELFSPRAGVFESIAGLSPQPGAQHGGGRWYPTALTLANGQVFAVAGHPFAGTRSANPAYDPGPPPNDEPEFLYDTTGQDDYEFGSDGAPRHNNNTPERYIPGDDEWVQVVNESTSHDNLGIDEYPRLHLAPSGLVFFSTIAKGKKRFYNPFTGAYDNTQVEPGNAAYHRGSEATSVVLPILPNDLEQVWVLACGAEDTFKINIEADQPVWQSAGTPQLGVARPHACAVLLPTGSVFVSGGEAEGFDEPDPEDPDPSENLPPAELYHPPIDWDELRYVDDPGTWEQIEAPLVARGYHTVQLLMPDGRVWIAGSTWTGWPQNGVEMEVYTPPYIVPGRVQITSAPPSIGYEGTIRVGLDSDQTITRAVLIRCGSTTHAFDSDQRYVVCQFQQSGTIVEVKAPVGPGVAPPGNYMLFLLDDQMIDGHGRPCVTAPILRLCDQVCEPVSNISKYSKLTVDALKDDDGNAVFTQALWLYLENYQPHEVDFPEPPVVTVRWDNPGNGTAVSSTLFELVWQNPWAEDNSLPPDLAQRFALRYDVKVHQDLYEDVNTERNLFVTWDFEHFRCSTMVQVSTKPNPFMVDIKDGNPHWLSTDLRVFSVRAGASPPPGALVLDDDESPFDYLEKALEKYNDPAASTDNLFDDLDTGQDASALQLKNTVGGDRIYNFVVAKVRYIGLGQNVEDVRVFFRMFNTVGTALEYDTGTTYRRKGNGPGAVPLLGIDGSQIISIPFFDKPRVTPHQAMTKQPPDEARTLVAEGATEYTRYFGAWLDINQDDDKHIPPLPIGDGPFPPLFEPLGPDSIKELVRGYHQCLVAEVHHLDDEIPGSTSPLAGTPVNNDNLSQRNLAWVPAGNPGAVATRTVQTTFFAKPSGTQPTVSFLPPTVVPRGQILRVTGEAGSTLRRRPMPDELVFDASLVPDGTRVTVYWPDVELDEVVALTRRRSSPVRFTVVDDRTISFELHGTTYLPLPGGRTRPIPGLLSAELPPGIVAGEQYKLVVHQFSGKKKRIVGTFELRIPVAHEADLLEQESTKLSMLRWIGQRIPEADVWYPIFMRYLGQIGDRVTGFGGDPNAVDPDPDGNGHPGGEAGVQGRRDRRRGSVVGGKVVEVRYDCFGDFIGFTLATCDTHVVFDSREPGIEALVTGACHDRTRIAVEVHPEDPCRFVGISMLCP